MPIERQIIIPNNLQEAFLKGRKDIVYFAKTFLGIELHDGQKKFVKNSVEKINILVPANRWGKSLLIACKQIWHCFYKIGVPEASEIGEEKWQGWRYETLNIAPHSEQARVVMDLIKDILGGMLSIGGKGTNECLIGWAVEEITQNPYMTIRFWNGAVLYSRTIGDDMGSSVQGQSYYYVSYDECCRSRHLEAELLDNILPRVASTNGKIDLISTPDKDSNSLRYYFQIYNFGKEGKPGYYSQDGNASDNPYLPPEYVEEIEEMRTDEGKDQVLYGKFVFSGEQFFAIDSLNKAVDNSYEYPEPCIRGHKYTIGIDTAAAEDYFVISVVDYTNINKLRLVRFDRSQGKDKALPLHLQTVREIYEHYNQFGQCELIVDKTNEGGAYITQFLEDLKPFGYRFGIKDGVNTKYDMLIALKAALEKDQIRIPYEKDLLDELWSYRTDDTKLRTDCVMSLGLAVWYATAGRPKKLPPVIDIDYLEW